MEKLASSSERYFEFNAAAEEAQRRSIGDIYQREWARQAANRLPLIHAVGGVEKGRSTSVTGQPIEVMGLVIGRTDPQNSRHVIITDAYPMPIEGTETRVLAETPELFNYMISIREQVEKSRKERIFGWYHSHPFDLDEHSHCFLSGTDVSSQLAWQRAEDKHGFPWMALVDPIRSVALERPVIEAFRTFHPEFSGNPELVAPDGKHHRLEKPILDRWGPVYRRFYTIPVEFFQSSLTDHFLSGHQDTSWFSPLLLHHFNAEEAQSSYEAVFSRLSSILQSFNDRGDAERVASRVRQVSEEAHEHLCALEAKQKLFYPA